MAAISEHSIKQTKSMFMESRSFELLKSVDHVIQHIYFQLKRMYLGMIKKNRIQLHNCHFLEGKDNLDIRRHSHKEFKDLWSESHLILQ